MDGAKINYLGLKSLIRYEIYREYMSFLGGEAQRPYLQLYSNTVSAEALITPSKNYQVNKNLYKFCPLQGSSFSKNVPSTKVTREKSLFLLGQE